MILKEMAFYISIFPFPLSIPGLSVIRLVVFCLLYNHVSWLPQHRTHVTHQSTSLLVLHSSVTHYLEARRAFTNWH